MIPAASSSLPFRTWVVMVAWLAAALCPRLYRADAAAPVPAAVRSFFTTHCLDCHDDATATAKLSLESLPDDFTRAAWVRVHDRIEKGDMPPADAAQPTRSERDEITGWLAKQLTQAATARQRSEGRVVLRRMNRREYEHTMQDLLGIAEPIGSMLPEDSVVHGFDTSSSGLDTSATHLLRYQQAADRGLDAALPPNPATAKPSHRQTQPPPGPGSLAGPGPSLPRPVASTCSGISSASKAMRSCSTHSLMPTAIRACTPPALPVRAATASAQRSGR